MHTQHLKELIPEESALDSKLFPTLTTCSGKRPTWLSYSTGAWTVCRDRHVYCSVAVPRCQNDKF